MPTTAKFSKATCFLLVCAVLSFGLCYAWFSLGVYSDREFGELYLFKKHRLSPRFYFYAPVGESDIPASSLSPSQQRAEAAFHDFVEVHGGDRRTLCILP